LIWFGEWDDSEVLQAIENGRASGKVVMIGTKTSFQHVYVVVHVQRDAAGVATVELYDPFGKDDKGLNKEVVATDLNEFAYSVFICDAP
jgi:hypothetical protein